MKKIIFYIPLIAIYLFVVACETPEPYGDLNITVLDDRGNELDSAEVTLYLTREDYNQETNAFLGPFFTNSNGVLKVFNLTDTTYYLNVVKGNLNNWENTVRIDLVKTENGFNNTKIFILSNSRSGIIASPEGKAWRISFIDPAANVPACLTDNRFIFYKGGVFEQDEGLSRCEINDPQRLIIGKWSFSPEETEFIFDYTEKPWLIITFNSSQLSLIGALDAIFPGNPELGTNLTGFVLVPE